jgi:hypothetical protein
MHVKVFTGFSCKKFEGMELETRYEEYIGVFIITYKNNKSQLLQTGAKIIQYPPTLSG